MAKDLLENFLRNLDRLHQTHRMYPWGHEQVASAAQLSARSLEEWGQPVRMSFVGEDLIIEDRSAHHFGDRLKGLIAAFRSSGWEGVRIDVSCGPSDLLEWMDRCRRGQSGPYNRGGVKAGHLDLIHHESGGGDRVKWSGSYSEYVPDVEKALFRVGRANPDGLELARGIVGNIFLRMDTADRLLAQARALKSFDEYTFTHALNVSIVSMAVAKHLRLPDATVQLIALAALFHDVGKERIPLEVLNKPGKLSAEEREVMNRHPVDGADLLLCLRGDVHPLLPTVAYQHHMGIDVSGYPVPHWKTPPHPASRLVAVADVFDALRTIRPYRGALTEGQAVTILLQDLRRGVLDPAAVTALVGVLGTLGAGQRVELADGRHGKVVAAGETDVLKPLIETDEGEILDLCDPAAPAIVAVHDAQEGAAAA